MTAKLNALRAYLRAQGDNRVLFVKDIKKDLEALLGASIHMADLRYELRRAVKDGLLTHYRQSPIYIVTSLALMEEDKPGWEYTDEQIVDLWAKGPGSTFLDFRKDGKEILADYDQWGRYDSERLWAAQSALLHGRKVPAAVLAKFHINRQDWEVIK